MKRCYLCGSASLSVKNRGTRDRANLKVRQCRNCSLTFLDNFFHLTESSYLNSENNYDRPVRNATAYRALLQELLIDDQRRFKQWSQDIKQKTILDFGCGAGGFLRLAQTQAKTVAGVEIDKITRFYKHQIDVRKNIAQFNQRFDVITLFHVLEHIPDPIRLLQEIKRYLRPPGRLIIEVPNDDDALIAHYKLPAFKNFTYWSWHLYSYNKKTLATICRRAGFREIRIYDYQRYPLANHIGWLKDGRPGGQKFYSALNQNKELNILYEALLKRIQGCDTLIAVVR